MNNIDHNKDREYQFDAIGRLTVAKGKATGQWTQTYTYDRFGNRTSVAATGTAADNSTMPTDGIPNLAFNTANNRITTTGFQYDVAGNQTRALAEDGTRWLNFEYDAANRLRVIKRDDTTTIQAFVYGSTNARLIDYDAGAGLNKFYAGGGGTPLMEYTEFVGNIPTWTKSYTYLGDSQLSTITPNGSGGEYTEYNHPDRLGTRLITNQAGGTSYEQAHLPFGKALNAESTITTNNKRFTSYDRSAPTGLDYAVNRTYDSKQGRFTQVDPIGMGGSSLVAPQTLNLYTYCGNDPINNTDPSGLFWGFLKKLFKWVVAAIAVIVAVITIVGVLALPATFAGIMGAISAGAAAGSSVMNALGYTTAAKILGWIAMGAGIAAATPSLIIKNIASTAEKTIPLWQNILRGISAVGAIANSFAKGNPKKNNGYPCAPTANRLLAQFGNFLSNLLEFNSGHQTNSPLENGGWFYQRKNGDLFFLRAEKFGGVWRRKSGAMDLRNPPNIKGARVVGKAHTHPYTEYEQRMINEGAAWGGPSFKDVDDSNMNRIPSLVAYQDEVSENGRRHIVVEWAANIWRINDETCKAR